MSACKAIFESATMFCFILMNLFNVIQKGILRLTFFFVYYDYSIRNCGGCYGYVWIMFSDDVMVKRKEIFYYSYVHGHFKVSFV